MGMDAISKSSPVGADERESYFKSSPPSRIRDTSPDPPVTYVDRDTCIIEPIYLRETVTCG